MGRTLWILIWLFIKTSANLCSKPCSCYDKTLDCSDLGLNTQIDDDLFNNTDKFTILQLNGNKFEYVRIFPLLPLIEYLSLANNSITTIDDGAFKFLSSLTTLDLSNNMLHSEDFGPDIFKGLYSPRDYEPLRKLRTLYLSSNQLHTLHPDLFEHLPKLESLSLDNNPFEYIDRGTVIALCSIQSLKILELSKTKLKFLPEFMLHTPRLLAVLNLSGNQFTKIPEEIGHTHQLKTLILDENPITEIDYFPEMKHLESLHLNWMPSLIQIGPHAFSNLTKLQEVMITFNMQLTHISPTAFSRIPDDGSEAVFWPEIKRLFLNNNQLRYLDSELIGRWDHLDLIDLKGNPWVCDCKNQWMISVLLPVIKDMASHHSEGIVCQEPIEMQGISMEDLDKRHYHMRCLDAYGHRPERDGNLLIGVVIGLFLAIPVTMALIILYRRRNLRPGQFSRAFYKSADGSQYFLNT